MSILRKAVLVGIAAIAGQLPCAAELAAQSPDACAPSVAVVTEGVAESQVALVEADVLERGWVPVADSSVFVAAASKPELKNARQVQLAIVKRYPANLRNAGVGGRTMIRLLVNASGRVGRAAVLRESGYAELDAAAAAAAREMRFEPYVHQGCIIPVVLDVPVEFWSR